MLPVMLPSLEDAIGKHATACQEVVVAKRNLQIALQKASEATEELSDMLANEMGDD